MRTFDAIDTDSKLFDMDNEEIQWDCSRVPKTILKKTLMEWVGKKIQQGSKSETSSIHTIFRETLKPTGYGKHNIATGKVGSRDSLVL